jgi:hypothetical protein
MITWLSIRPASGDSAAGSSGSSPRTTRRTKNLAAHGAPRIRNGVATIVRMATARRYWYTSVPTNPSRNPSDIRRKENSPICASPTAPITETLQGYFSVRIAAPAQNPFNSTTVTEMKRIMGRWRTRNGRSSSIPTEMKKTPLKTSRKGKIWAAISWT